MKRIDVSRLTPVDSMRGDDDTETLVFQRLHRKAEDFLGSFTWCRGIKTAHFGLGISNIVAVFLFEIHPLRPDVDELVQDGGGAAGRAAGRGWTFHRNFQASVPWDQES